MVGVGLFEGRNIELVSGEVLEMSPQDPSHAGVLMDAEDAIREAFAGSNYRVRTQMPLSLGADSEPEPDIAVVEGGHRFRERHPITADLVVEVASTSLAFDRSHKASLYAAAGIADYWVVNTWDGQVEIHRDPVPDPDQPHGARYTSVTIVQPGGTVVPLVSPQAEIAVADLLR